MRYLRDPETIEANIEKADNLELLSFLWREYYDSANYDQRRTGETISKVGNRVNQLKTKLREDNKYFNEAGDCICQRPRQLCICDIDLT